MDPYLEEVLAKIQYLWRVYNSSWSAPGKLNVIDDINYLSWIAYQRSPQSFTTI